MGELRQERRALAARRRRGDRRARPDEQEHPQPLAEPLAGLEGHPPCPSARRGDDRSRRRRSVRLVRPARGRARCLCRELHTHRFDLAELSANPPGGGSRLRPVAGGRAPRGRRTVPGERLLRSTMIVVSVGTNEARFDRLLEWLSDLELEDDLVVQHGPSTVRPPGSRCVPYLPYEDL